MKSHFNRGVRCIATNRYLLADSPDITPNTKIVCPICDKRAILRRGDVRIHHFAHYKRAECCFYNETGVSKATQESFLHKHCKMLIADKLNAEKHLSIRISPCSYCRRDTEREETVECQTDEEAIVEFRHTERNRVYDVAVVNRLTNKVSSILEIKHTHATEEGSRPEPWYELATEDIIKGKFQNTRGCQCIYEDGVYFDYHDGEGNPRYNPAYDDDDDLAESFIDAKYKKLGRKKVFLKVSFQQKDIAKSLGARWDPDAKLWYAPGWHNKKQKPSEEWYENRDELFNKFQRV